jgi:glyoxylase-like metal-dependent hydrolase (beta-lactamase superfamily II)
VVPDHNAIRISGNDPDRILYRLTLDGRREFPSILGGDDLAAKPQHGRLEAEAGAGRRLVENGRQDPVAQDTVAGSHRFHAIRLVEQLHDPVTLELLDCHDMLHLRYPSHTRTYTLSEVYRLINWSMANQMYMSLGNSTGAVPGGTNIGVIRHDDRHVSLIDTGLNDTTARKVLRAVREELGSEVVAVINTHGHADHFGANAFVHKRTGCEFWAPAIETTVIGNPILQPALLYGGADPADALRNRFLLAESGPTPSVIGPGKQSFHGTEIEIVPLGGHSPNQVGIVVDGVFFCADVVFPDAAIEKYRIPYLYGLTDHLASLAAASLIDAASVVPGHGPILDEIGGAVARNLAAIDLAIAAILDVLAEPLTSDEVCVRVFNALDVPVNDAQGYYLLRPTISAYLAHLERENLVDLTMAGREVRWLRA